MTHQLRSILIVLAVFAAAPAWAQPADFRATYERGMAAFHKKEFAKARTEFLAAWALNNEPTVLFAIAQTYRFEGNFKEAIDWYRKFLADSQAAQDLRSEAQTYLDESEARQSALEEARRKAAEAGPKEADGKPAKMPPTTTTTLAPPNVKVTTKTTRHRRIPLGSKIGAGVTAAGLVTSIIVTKLGLDIESEFKARGAAATPKDAAVVERYETGINIAWGLTAAAAATTVVLYFATPSYTTDKRLVLAPTDGGFSAGFTTRF